MNLACKYAALNKIQKGAFGEAYARMAFALEQFEVFVSECDDSGVDFVIKSPRSVFYEVQVKTTDKTVNPCIYADKFRMMENFLFVAVRLNETQEPELFVARGTEWRIPGGCINFNPKGGKAGPYYEMVFSCKHAKSLERFRFGTYVVEL